MASIPADHLRFDAGAIQLRQIVPVVERVIRDLVPGFTRLAKHRRGVRARQIRADGEQGERDAPLFGEREQAIHGDVVDRSGRTVRRLEAWIWK